MAFTPDKSKNDLFLGLSSKQLKAFFALAQTSHFSHAAALINITQSALSQRIKALENNLGEVLLIRDSKHVALTAAGERLLRYCQLLNTFEKELLQDIGRQQQGELAGVLRVGGFSSVMRSVIMPLLSEQVVREHERVTCEFAVDEMHSLTKLLLKGVVDMVVTQNPIKLHGVTNIELGYERNFLLESSQYEVPDVYIDHDADDHFTEYFLQHQDQALNDQHKSLRRAFYSDIYGLLDAVEQGVGRAVIPMHLIESRHAVQPVAGYQPVDVPVVLNFFGSIRHSRLHMAAIELLTDSAGKCLERDQNQLQKQAAPGIKTPTPYAL